jgi:hypothetical protein
MRPDRECIESLTRRLDFTIALLQEDWIEAAVAAPMRFYRKSMLLIATLIHTMTSITALNSYRCVSNKETKTVEEKPVQDDPVPSDKDFNMDLLFAMAEELVWAEAVEENENYRYKRENPS